MYPSLSLHLSLSRFLLPFPGLSPPFPSLPSLPASPSSSPSPRVAYRCVSNPIAVHIAQACDGSTIRADRGTLQLAAWAYWSHPVSLYLPLPLCLSLHLSLSSLSLSLPFPASPRLDLHRLLPLSSFISLPLSFPLSLSPLSLSLYIYIYI